MTLAPYWSISICMKTQKTMSGAERAVLNLLSFKAARLSNRTKPDDWDPKVHAKTATALAARGLVTIEDYGVHGGGFARLTLAGKAIAKRLKERSEELI